MVDPDTVADYNNIAQSIMKDLTINGILASICNDWIGDHGSNDINCLVCTTHSPFSELNIQYGLISDHKDICIVPGMYSVMIYLKANEFVYSLSICLKPDQCKNSREMLTDQINLGTGSDDVIIRTDFKEKYRVEVGDTNYNLI